jgi:hypothetical protein
MLHFVGHDLHESIFLYKTLKNRTVPHLMKQMFFWREAIYDLRNTKMNLSLLLPKREFLKNL